jgi:RHS repeat-associated protein
LREIRRLTESFGYDADQRLNCTALSSTCTTQTLVYDGGLAGPGNITSQTGLGTYAYPAAGQPRPHAVTSLTGTFNGIVNPTFSYDANGNMTGRASAAQNVFWTASNYPSTISATDITGSEEVQLSYGPDRQRWKQIYTGPSGTENTYYIGGLMDKVHTGTTDYRHYIYAGSEPIAIYSRTGTGSVTMRYMLEDHQGGVSNIASNAGASDVNESFSAFGTRRNPTTWSGAPTSTDLNTIAGLSRQGYTFQTWLGQSMGLNHMNGRVEDAILGRFLSPDTHIPNPADAQSYNRYSYVNNNPLSFTDPSGFTPCTQNKFSMNGSGCGSYVDSSVGDLIGTFGQGTDDGFDNLRGTNEGGAGGTATGIAAGAAQAAAAARAAAQAAAEGPPTPSAQRNVTPNNSGVSITWVIPPFVMNDNGGFAGAASFNVPDGANGVIIQQVTFGDDGSSAGGVYYEAWIVQNGQVVPGDDLRGNDVFRSPTAADSSVTGLVQFYPGATMSDFPGLVATGMPPAGDLPMSYTQPANWTAEGALVHQIVVLDNLSSFYVIPTPPLP